MVTATVIEIPARLEPVTPDTFTGDLDRLTFEGRPQLIAPPERVAAAPRRRIYD